MRYIEKVKKHIKNAKKAKEIECELFDHIDEHESFFVEIGYDDEAAEEKAEEKMGDAEVVGEQFSAIIKPARAKAVAEAVLLGVLVLCVVLFYVNRSAAYGNFVISLSSTEYYNRSFIFSAYQMFYALCEHGAMLCLAFVLMALGIKEKRIVNTVLSYLSSLVLIILGPYEWLDIFNFNSYITGFYLRNSEFFGPTYLSPLQFVAIIAVALVVTVLFALGMNNIIKSKKLRNSRKSMLASRVAKAALSVLSVLCIVFLAVTTLGIIQGSERVISKHKEELLAVDEFIIDNYQNVADCKCDELERSFREQFGDDVIVDEAVEQTDFNYYSPHGVMVYFEKYTDEETTMCNLVSDGVLYDPFSYYYEIINILDEVDISEEVPLDEVDISEEVPLEEAPLPAYIRTNSSEDGRNDLTFYYDFHHDIKIVYEYKMDTKILEFLFSSMLKYDKKVSLTDEQKTALDKRMYEDYFYYVAASYEYEKEENKMLITNDEVMQKYCDNKGLDGTLVTVFTTRYNEDTDLYKLKLGYVNYSYPFTSGIYPPLSHTDIVEYLEMIVRFTDDGIDIIETCEAEDPKYWESGDGVEEYEAFTSKGIHNMIVEDMNNKKF